MTNIKELPSSPDAERYILGGIILDNELILQTLDKISSEDFYVGAHKPIYQAMEHLYDGGVEINHVTLTDALKTLGLYNAGTTSEVAGLLLNLVKGVPASSDISYYVNILKERSKERKKLRLSSDLSTALYNGDLAAVENIENQLNELAIESHVDGLQPIGESLGSSVLQKAHKLGVTGTKLIGLPTGIYELDKITAGLNRQEMTILAARPAMGKEQPLDAKILTPTGWTTMGEVRIGDEVITKNGKSTRVTGVFPQGIKPVYRVSFSDGTSTECGLDHLWEVSSRKKDWTRKKRYVLTLSEIMKDYILSGGRKNYAVDRVQPVDFIGKSELPLHPYLLGVLIGDGGLTKSNPTITSVDTDIIDRCKLLLPESDTLSTLDNVNFRIRNKKRTNLLCSTQKVLKELNVCHKSYHKFVPYDYLYSTVESRIELLKGLMDTDGSIDKNGSLEFCSSSEILAQNFKELVLSLGGKARIVRSMASYQVGGRKIETCFRYRVHLSINFNPFFCERKSERYSKLGQIPTLKYIQNIEYTGEKKCQCIMVKDSSHLYVTDDYIVTHNTALALNIAQHLTSKDYVVAMFSMEMSREMLYLRLIASEARLDLHKLKTGTLSKLEWARAIHAHDKLSKAKLLVDATSFMTPRMMETALKKAVRRHGKVDVIIVDYLQLMSSTNNRENRQQEVSEISRHLREMARRNDAHMLALSQLSRAPETRSANMHRPQPSDLRDSGSIEQDADMVVMLYREEVYNPDAVKGSAELIISKSRNSAMGTINLFYMKNQTRFENVFMS